MSEPKEIIMTSFRSSAIQRMKFERAAEIKAITLSEFIRDAVIPVANEVIVADALKAPMGDAA